MSEQHPKPQLSDDELTPADLKRARATVLEGRNPWEVMEDRLDAMTLIIWCIKSRADPGFTWEQAEHTKLGEFDMTGEPPPPTPGPQTNGTAPGPTATRASRPKPRATEPEPSSASSSG
jgi:hypothetical protein